MDNVEFLLQMVQFLIVEGIEQVNEIFVGFEVVLGLNCVVIVVSLLGYLVLVFGVVVCFDISGEVYGMFELDIGVSVIMIIYLDVEIDVLLQM